MNNIRLRHNITKSRLSLLPVGTTSNEALHSEINRWFKETQKIHPSTLELKLDVLSLGKLLLRNRALYYAGAKQMSHSAVLAQAAGASMWTSDSWAAWCEELGDAAQRKCKADLPRQEELQTQKRRLSDWNKKKPAAAKKIQTKTHRTPRTLLRQDELIRGGKKNSDVLSGGRWRLGSFGLTQRHSSRAGACK